MKTPAKKAQCLPVEYSEKAVSPWGGMRFVQELIERMGLAPFLEKQDLPKPGSKVKRALREIFFHAKGAKTL